MNQDLLPGLNSFKVWEYHMYNGSNKRTMNAYMFRSTVWPSTGL